MDLLSEWHKWDSNSFPHMLEADADVLKSRWSEQYVAKHRSWDEAIQDHDFCEPNDTRLHLGLLPTPFMGDMRNASIYVLMLNPGLSPCDYYGEYQISPFRQALLANLRQERLEGVMPFISLDPQFAWHSGFDYWHGKLRKVIQELAKARSEKVRGTTFAEARSELGAKLAVVQLVPYHSASFTDRGRLLDDLYSVQLAGEFVQETVAKRVRAKQAIAIVTRQVERWNKYLPEDLTDKQGVTRYTQHEARGASLSPTSPGGRAILRHLGVNPESK